MYLTLQFPIADIRQFLQGGGECLATPSWPTPEVSRQFVRYFGPVQKRLLGGSGVKWMGDELYFCDSSNAIRFGDLGSIEFPAWARRTRVLRRLFLHKPALARIEVSFAMAFDQASSLSGDHVIDCLNDILNLPTRVPSLENESRRSSDTKLAYQGRKLARLFRRATVSAKSRPLTDDLEWTVRDGDPMLLVEYGRDEIEALPEQARQIPVDETHGFRISWMTDRKHGRPIVIWFLEASPGGESKVVRRQLRMCLLRMHLEYQVLRLVLNALFERDSIDPGPEGFQKLESYLDESTRRLFKKSRFGVSQKPLYLANAANHELIREEYQSVLKSKLSRFREQVSERLDRIIAETTSTESASAAIKTMRLLYLAANPPDTERLDIEDELRCLEIELRGVEFRDSIAAIPKHAVRPDDLIRHIRDSKPNIVHFSGHGTEQGLYLRDEKGGIQPIDSKSLKSFLKDREVDLVVLNACFSKHLADDLLEVVKAVVFTEGEIEDEAASLFTLAFYRSLGNGLTVREALRDGSDAVRLHDMADRYDGIGDLDLVMTHEA